MTNSVLRWRANLWIPTAWLTFLMFPVITITSSDLVTGRKTLSIALIAVFAIVYVIGFGVTLDRDFGGTERPRGTRALWHRDGAWLYLFTLTILMAAAVAVAGWAPFGMAPYLVAFAIFNYSWRTSLIISAAVLAATFVGPLVTQDLGELWFFSLLVLSVGAGCAFTRLADEHQIEQSEIKTELALSEQRTAVARDVHDVLGHSLTAVILKVQVCRQLLDRLDPSDETNQSILRQCQRELAELDQVSRSAMAEIRSTVGGLRRADLGDELAAARTVLADAGATLTVQGNRASVPETYQSMLAWVVRESVTNIVRHARATSCTIEFPGDDEDQLLMGIHDDGIGTNGAAEGNGLRGMRERIEDGGATLTVRSAKGTRIEVRR